jgi:radical SAM superfamily enzyme YgiQ (UPF0313 family)
MIEDSIVIRPPSEARSFLLPVTEGCSHNRCTFCGTFTDFKFHTYPPEEITGYIDAVAERYGDGVRRVFLENGDALAAPQDVLRETLTHLKTRLPRLQRVGTYATPKSALVKSVGELKELRELGLKIAYLGVESGDAEVLEKVCKGATYDEIVTAGRKLKEAGITVSATVILGLGGPELSERHAVATGKILSDIDPQFAGALTLMLVPGSALHRDWQEGKFHLISPRQSLVELKLIIENSNFTSCFFTSNHASNYLPVRVRLPQQKREIIRLIDGILAGDDDSMLRPEAFRGL